MGPVQGRQTRDGTRRILDLLQIAKTSLADSVLLSLDAEKAFDRVNWLYLQKVLHKFGFVGPIYDAILSLYTCPSASVFSSGFFSSHFPITNGTRQGCPLSPLIFALSIEPLAEMIRNSSDISGLIVQNEVHKISLYADDILISCTNPLRSVSALLKILDEFSEVSYYKLNRSKSTIFPITNSETLRSSLAGFNFIWSETFITYLGIKLTHSPMETMQKNYQELAQTFTSECNRFSQTNTSWIARISLIKLFLLPKYIYICRAIPYIIPKVLIDKLQSILLQFIWQNTKSRVNKQLLYRDANVGGLAVPNLAAYNIAAFIDQASILWDLESSQIWAKLENECLPYGTTKDLLSSIYLGLTVPPQKLLSTSHLLKVWKASVMDRNWLYLEKYEISLQSLRCEMSRESWPNWDKFGIYSLQPLYEADTIKTFAYISNQHNIPNRDFFQYLQLRHILHLIKWPPRPSGEVPFRKFLHKSKGFKKGLTLSYKLQVGATSASKGANMIKWEGELQKTFSLEEWTKALQTSSKLSHCINYKEIMRKIHLRWFLTPNRLAHMKSDATNLCWRQCGHIGSQLHMWWSCPITTSFWQQINNILMAVLGCKIVLSPEWAVFDIHLVDFLLGLGGRFCNIFSLALDLLLRNTGSRPMHFRYLR